MQQRLHKFSREPERLGHRQITERSLQIIETIRRHRILPTSLLVRLIPGNHRITQAHLQMLYHRGLINRFAFFRAGRPGEFHYYLDNTRALDLLAEQGSVSALDFEGVRRNKEKDYAAIHDPARAEDMEGRRLFLKHEVMISRFHATLELAAQRSVGAVELAAWQQGPQLWSSVEVEEGERLPHRPDAYFALRFKNSLQGDSEAHFFYEADRKTTSTTKHNRKLRAHFYFIVKKKLHELTYGIKRIRAVLIETLDDAWAETLRSAAGEYAVSGSKPSPLFWFTTSRLFTQTTTREGSGASRHT